MKRPIIFSPGTIWVVVLILLTGSLPVLNSCDNEDESPPVITSVRYTDPELADVNLNMERGATLGTWVIIEGQHLGTTRFIYFNGVEASFIPTYITDNNIVVFIPDKTPNIATHPDSLVLDEVKVVTDYGEDTYELLILPPPPTLDSISNEFANAGDEITLYGKYFYFLEEVLFPGDIPGTNVVVSEDAKSLQVTVPDGITEGGYINIRSQSGFATFGKRARFNDTTGIFIDCEDPTIQGNAAGVQFYDQTTNPSIPNCREHYILAFTFNIVPASWWIPETALETNLGDYSKLTYPDYPDDTPVNNLELRFEAFIKSPWYSGFYEMAFLQNAAWTKAYRYFWQPWTNAPNSTLVTDGWLTFTVPVSAFTVDAAGVEAPLTYGDIRGEPFNFNLKNPGPDGGGQTIDVFNIAFDNFRLVITE